MECEKMMTTCRKEYMHSSRKERNNIIRLQIHKVSTGHAYIYGQVRNVKTRHSRITKIMIDQGNLLEAGVGIYEAFLKNEVRKCKKGSK